MLAQAACELFPQMHTPSWRRAAHSCSYFLPSRRPSTTSTPIRSMAPSPPSSCGSHATCSSRAGQPSEGSDTDDHPSFVGITDSMDLSQTTETSLFTSSSQTDSEATELGPSNELTGSSAAGNAASAAASASQGSSGMRPAARAASGQAGRRGQAAAVQQSGGAGSNATCSQQGPSGSLRTGKKRLQCGCTVVMTCRWL